MAACACCVRVALAHVHAHGRCKSLAVALRTTAATPVRGTVTPWCLHLLYSYSPAWVRPSRDRDRRLIRYPWLHAALHVAGTHMHARAPAGHVTKRFATQHSCFCQIHPMRQVALFKCDLCSTMNQSDCKLIAQYEFSLATMDGRDVRQRGVGQERLCIHADPILRIVAAHYAVDFGLAMISVSVTIWRNEDLLRPILRVQHSRAPNVLVAVCRSASSTLERLQTVLRCNPAGRLNGLIHDKSPIQHALVNRRFDIVQLLMQQHGIDLTLCMPWRAAERHDRRHSLLSYACKLASEGAPHADAGELQACALSLAHAVDGAGEPVFLPLHEGARVVDDDELEMEFEGPRPFTAHHSHLFSVFTAGFVDILAVWSARGLLPAVLGTAMVAWYMEGSGGTTVVLAMCQALLDMSPLERQNAFRCFMQCPTLHGPVSSLYFACSAGLPDVVARLCADVDGVLAVLHDRNHLDQGHTPFTVACSRTSASVDASGPFQALAECARLLAALPQCDPAAVSGEGQAQLAWAAKAGLADVVQAWAADERCTAAVLRGYNAELVSVFAGLCNRYKVFLDYVDRLPNVQAAADRTLACALALCKSGKISPAAVDKIGKTNMFLAYSYGLAGVLSYWIEHDRVAVEEVLHTPNAADLGGVITPFAWICMQMMLGQLGDACMRQYAVSAQVLSSLTACDPSVVSASGYTQLEWAVLAGLDGIVRTWLQDARCTPAIVNRALHQGARPIFELISFNLAQTHPVSFGRVTPAETRKCAVALGTSGKCDPHLRSGYGGNYLYYACDAGLHEVVAYWTEHNSAELAIAVNSAAGYVHGQTPFSVACQHASDPECSAELRVDLLQCARLLLQSPSFDPAAIAGEGRTNASWAASAGLMDAGPGSAAVDTGSARGASAT